MNETQKINLQKIIDTLNKSGIVFMEYMRRFEPSWSDDDKQEAKVMLGEMVLLNQGFQKALDGEIKGRELEAILSLIPTSQIVYDELLINVSRWLKQDDQKS